MKANLNLHNVKVGVNGRKKFSHFNNGRNDNENKKPFTHFIRSDNGKIEPNNNIGKVMSFSRFN